MSYYEAEHGFTQSDWAEWSRGEQEAERQAFDAWQQSLANSTPKSDPSGRLRWSGIQGDRPPLISPETGEPLHCERCGYALATHEVDYQDDQGRDACDQVCDYCDPRTEGPF